MDDTYSVSTSGFTPKSAGSVVLQFAFFCFMAAAGLFVGVVASLWWTTADVVRSFVRDLGQR